MGPKSGAPIWIIAIVCAKRYKLQLLRSSTTSNELLELISTASGSTAPWCFSRPSFYAAKRTHAPGSICPGSIAAPAERPLSRSIPTNELQPVRTAADDSAPMVATTDRAAAAVPTTGRELDSGTAVCSVCWRWPARERKPRTEFCSKP